MKKAIFKTIKIVNIGAGLKKNLALQIETQEEKNVIN